MLNNRTCIVLFRHENVLVEYDNAELLNSPTPPHWIEKGSSETNEKQTMYKSLLKHARNIQDSKEKCLKIWNDRAKRAGVKEID